MSAKKLIAAALLAGAVTTAPVRAEVPPASARQMLNVQAAGSLAVATPLVAGKRPPLLGKRPDWLGNLAGDTLFLSRFGQAFDRLDKNHDGLLRWAEIDAQGKLHPEQAGPEPLPASYDACYLIDYVHRAAKTEKDPAHPGQYVETPESYEITGWKTWKEALAGMNAPGYPAQSPTGVCNKTEKRIYCKTGAMEIPRTCTWGQCNCYPGPNTTLIQKDVCVEPETVPTPFTREQWLKVAKDHFQREDWNHDGKLDAEEAKEFVCPGE